MTFYDDHCSYLIPMGGWFFFSTLLTTYNKEIFGSKQMAFPCPLLMTSVHFFAQWIICYSLTSFFPRTFGGAEVKAMSWRTYLLVSIPCGCVTSFDIGLSNEALVRITITFYTMVKASSPIFVLFFAFIFRIEKITLSLIMVIAVIAFGELLTVYGETEFNLLGFILCLSSSVLAGLRWTLVQFSLNSLDPPLASAISTLRVISSSMFISLFIISLIVEKPIRTLSDSPFFATSSASLETFLIGIVGAFLAVSMILCEYNLIMKSSALILMIGGIIKELTNIFLGVSVFKDTLDALNVTGCSIVFGGVILYKIIFHSNVCRRKEQCSHPGQFTECKKILTSNGETEEFEIIEFGEGDTSAGLGFDSKNRKNDFLLLKEVTRLQAEINFLKNELQMKDDFIKQINSKTTMNSDTIVCEQAE